jgi:hypothetical protein
MKKFFGLGLFFLCFALGYILIEHNAQVESVLRDPAAVNVNFDYSELTGSQLLDAIKNRLISPLEVRKTSTGAGLILGHFVFRNQKGEKRLACEEFSKVAFSFIAEGASVNGELPLMEVEGRCEFSSDLSKTVPIMVPISKIFQEKPGDGEFEFREGSPVVVRFLNLPEDWPKKWLLKSVKLINEKTSESLIVEREEILMIRNNPIVLKF